MRKVKVIKERYYNGKMHIFESERIEHTPIKDKKITCHVVNTVTGRRIIEYR